MPVYHICLISSVICIIYGHASKRVYTVQYCDIIHCVFKDIFAQYKMLDCSTDKGGDGEV